tara:strand:- start:1018 stop:1188 length:171 start_codon:yes stop_codon:yes gene_type:complete
MSAYYIQTNADLHLRAMLERVQTKGALVEPYEEEESLPRSEVETREHGGERRPEQG